MQHLIVGLHHLPTLFGPPVPEIATPLPSSAVTVNDAGINIPTGELKFPHKATPMWLTDENV